MADALNAAPHTHRAIFENDRVRILEYRAAPGVRAEMHSHPDLVSVAIHGGKVRFTLPNGEITDAELADGEARFQEATDHVTENVGTSEVQIVLIELK